MARGELPGSFEQLVLLALLRLGEDAYGVSVQREIFRRSGRDVSLGAVYATLERMEEKGWIRSRVGAATAERGGRAKRHYRIQASGTRALRDALATLDQMREDLPGLAQPGGA
jgi:PadR family transcriptional regulator PadR